MKPIEPEEENSANTLRRNLLPLAKQVAAGIGIFWLVLTCIIGLVWQEDAGTVGDTFGAVNALFSGLALAGVIIAILLQSEDLRAQERAMELQTKEMKDTTEALEAQTKLLDAQVRHGAVQSFDARFFELLRFARSGWDNLDCHFAGGNRVVGSAAISGLSQTLGQLTEPSFDPEKYRQNFDRFKKRHGRDYEPATQMMRLSLEMVCDYDRGEPYASIWKATFSHEEKWLFAHVQFFASKGIPVKLVWLFENHALLAGIESPLAMTMELGLKPTAFGKTESAAT